MSAPGCIYAGTIRHRRFAVRTRAFRHRLALLYVDVERLDEVLGGRLVAAWPGPVRFRRADYLGDPRRPLDDDVRRRLEERTGRGHEGPVRLLTHPPTIRHSIKPDSDNLMFDGPDRLGARYEKQTTEIKSPV